MAFTVPEQALINMAVLLLGQAKVSNFSVSGVSVRAAEIFYEQARDEMFDTGDDWYFLRARAELDMLYLLTVDSSPSPAAWSAAAALTGTTSGVTCTVVQQISTTIYLVTAPSADFTDGEVISDGTNSIDCATGYPETDEAEPNTSGWEYMYKLPTSCVRVMKVVDETGDELEYPWRREVHIDAGDNETDVLLHNYNECFVRYLRKRTVPTTWPAWFRKLVYHNLARLMAMKITGEDRKKADLLTEWWADAIRLAREANAMRDADTDGAGVNLDLGNTDVITAADESTLKDLPPNYD